jgi:photosystem II stability/assembly factor-like uncharacterized protein
MTKGKVIRYSVELLILLVLIAAYFIYFQPREPVDYPGTWIRTPGPRGSVARTLLWVSGSSHLLAGSKVADAEGGIGVYDPKEIRWEYPQTGLESNHAVVDLERVGEEIWAPYFASRTSPGGILVSRDEGQSWGAHVVIPEKPDPRCLAVAGKDKDTVLLGTVEKGVLRSKDHGKTWSESNTGLTNLRIQTLCVNPEDPQIVLAGTLNGMYASDDAGKSWHLSNKGLPQDYSLVVCLAADPHHRDRFLAVVRDGRARGFVYRSKNAGKSWHVVMTGLPVAVQPRSIAYHPGKKNVIYVGTVHDGVFRTDDGGKYWSSMSKGLPLEKSFMIIHSLSCPETPADMLFAGTDVDGSVWEYRFK